MMMGCEDCADILEDVDMEAEDFDLCPHCGGRLLTVQEGFDMIIQLKREAENEREY